MDAIAQDLLETYKGLEKEYEKAEILFLEKPNITSMALVIEQSRKRLVFLQENKMVEPFNDVQSIGEQIGANPDRILELQVCVEYRKVARGYHLNTFIRALDPKGFILVDDLHERKWTQEELQKYLEGTKSNLLLARVKTHNGTPLHSELHIDV